MRRAVVVDGEAAILPAEAALFLPRLQPMLARLGIALVDVPRPTVDLTTGELVITSPAIDHDADVVTRLATGVRLGRGERPVVDAGRYPLRAWCMVRHGPGLVTRLSTAEAAVGVVSSISGTDDLASRLGELGAMFADGPPTGFGIWHSDESDFIAGLEAAILGGIGSTVER